jgi:hypothetical protein
LVIVRQAVVIFVVLVVLSDTNYIIRLDCSIFIAVILCCSFFCYFTFVVVIFVIIIMI